MYSKTILIGRLVADPELKQTQNGISVTSFCMAVDRPYQKDKERQTDFINLVAWRGTAEFINKFFSKGSMIGVDGRIQTRNYQDKDGNKRTAFEVLADNAFFVESAKQNGTSNAQQPSTPVPANNNFQEVDNSEDLPF